MDKPGCETEQRSIKSAIRSSFYHQRQLEVHPLCSRHHFEILIQDFISTHSDYCGVFYGNGLSQSSLAWLKVLLQLTCYLAAWFWIDFFLIVFKMSLSLLSNLLLLYVPLRSHRSAESRPKDKEEVRSRSIILNTDNINTKMRIDIKMILTWWDWYFCVYVFCTTDFIFFSNRVKNKVSLQCWSWDETLPLFVLTLFYLYTCFDIVAFFVVTLH